GDWLNDMTVLHLARDQKCLRSKSVSCMWRDLPAFEQQTILLLQLHPRQRMDAQVSAIQNNKADVRRIYGDSKRSLRIVFGAFKRGLKYVYRSLSQQPNR